MVFTAELKGAFYHRMFILLFLLLLLDLVVGLFFKLIFIYIDIYIDINAKLLQRINVNIWKNSYSVINCFQNIKNKNNKSYFITFDICNFYPSITMKTSFAKPFPLHHTLPTYQLNTRE